jgi:hypothetical protein
MPRRRPHPPHCVPKRRQYFAKLMIPKDVQHVLERKVFLQPLGVPVTEPDKAYTKSIPIIQEWRERIEQARRSCTDPALSQREQFVRDYSRSRGKTLDAASAALLRDAYDFFYRKAKIITDEQYERIVAARSEAKPPKPRRSQPQKA